MQNDDNTIAKHWKEELETFNKNLSLLKRENNEDAVHDLRVAVKKLRSYLKLYITISGNKQSEKLFEKTEELFSVLGVQRNIEICEKLLPSFKTTNKQITSSLNAYFDVLHEQTSKYSRVAITSYNKSSLDRLTARLLRDMSKLSEEEAIGKISSIINKYLKQLDKEMKDIEKRFHKVRKLLKDIYYWLKLLPHGTVLSKAEVKKIDKMLEGLGNAQDCDVMIEYLKGYRKSVLTKENTSSETVKRMEGRLEKKKNQPLDKLIPS